MRSFFLAPILMCLLVITSAAEPSAVEKLEKTPIFAFGGIGYAGATCEGEIAFHTIFQSDSGESQFVRVLKSGNGQAKCYALVGLRLKSRAAFNEQVKPFVTSKQEVQTCSGCIMMKLPMSTVVASI